MKIKSKMIETLKNWLFTYNSFSNSSTYVKQYNNFKNNVRNTKNVRDSTKMDCDYP